MTNESLCPSSQSDLGRVRAQGDGRQRDRIS